jgi:outer membrane protein assembly factor BamB
MKTRFKILIFLVFISFLVPFSDGIDPIWNYPSGGNTVGTPVISSEGSMIMVPAGKILVFSRNGSLQSAEPYGSEIAMTPDGRNLVSSFASIVYFFKISQSPYSQTDHMLTKIWQYEFPDQVRSIGISDDGTTMIVATRSMGIYTFDTSTQEIAANDEDYNAVISFFGEDNQVIGISRNQVQIFNNELAPLGAYEISTSSTPTMMILLQSGTRIIFNDGQKIHCIDNTENATELWSMTVPGTISALTSLQTDNLIIAGTETGFLDTFNFDGKRSWNYSSNPEKKQSAGITGIATNGSIVAAGTFDGKIIWFDSNGTVLGSFTSPDRIRHVAISPDGSVTVAVGDDAIYAFSSVHLKVPLPDSQSVSANSTIKGENIAKPAESTVKSLNPTQVTVPEEYSTIHTPTKSSFAEFASIFALLIAIILYLRKI